jgi:hypothetical protein
LANGFNTGEATKGEEVDDSAGLDWRKGLFVLLSKTDPAVGGDWKALPGGLTLPDCGNKAGDPVELV